MNMQMLALAFLAATAIGGVAWVFIYPMLSGEKQAEARRALGRQARSRRHGATKPRTSVRAASRSKAR